MNRDRIDAIFMGILLLAVGLLFLLDNLNILNFNFWTFLGRYWPTILIYIGLKNIILHLAERE